MTDETIGNTLTGLGILLVACNLTIWNNTKYGAISAAAAVLVIVGGLYFTSWKNRGEEDDD